MQVQLPRISPYADREEMIDYLNELVDELEFLLPHLDDENTTEEYEEKHRNGDD